MKKIVFTSKIKNDEYTNYVYQAFDIQDKDNSTVEIENRLYELDNLEDWNVGVLFGASGSGKTTLLKTFGDLTYPEFSDTKPLISNFDWLEPEEATKLLMAMGLSSVPTWLRPYRVLSNGEQFRARLAMAVSLYDGIILIDEFTSVVNREVAKAMSYTLQKYIRKTGKQIVLASCHDDIFPYLTPDWIYNTDRGKLFKVSYNENIEIQEEEKLSKVKTAVWKK